MNNAPTSAAAHPYGGANHRGPPSAAAIAAPVILAMLAGCGPGGSVLSAVSYKDPYFPERHELRFSSCAWRRLPGGDYQFAAAADAGGERRLLDVRVFWNPSTGRIRTNKTSLDAAIRCVVASAGGAVAVYHGTGFVYFKPGRGPIDARIESGQLRLVTGLGPSYADWGETRVTGRLRALPDPGATIDVARECDLLAARRTASSEGAP